MTPAGIKQPWRTLMRVQNRISPDPKLELMLTQPHRQAGSSPAPPPPRWCWRAKGSDRRGPDPAHRPVHSGSEAADSARRDPRQLCGAQRQALPRHGKLSAGLTWNPRRVPLAKRNALFCGKILKNREPPPALRRSPNAGGGTKPPAPWHFLKERRGRDARGGGSPPGEPLRAGNLPLLPPAHRRGPAGGRSVSADLFKTPGADPHTGRTEQSPGAAVQPGGRHFQKRTAQSWAAAGHCKAGGAGRGQRPQLPAPDDPAQTAQNRAQSAALLAAVDQLPPKLRIPITLAYGFDWNLEEIARMERPRWTPSKAGCTRPGQLLKKEMEAQAMEHFDLDKALQAQLHAPTPGPGPSWTRP